jgi:signal peptidase
MKQTTIKLLHSPAAYIVGRVLSLSSVLTIFMLIPVVLVIFLTSQTAIVGGIRSFVVPSGSMKPALEVGSMIFTIPQSNYKIGEVIAFRKGNINVTHRIHGVTPAGFVTKGDANTVPDAEIVKKSDVIGRDVIVVPKIGNFITYIKSPFGFLSILGIPTILFVLFEAFQIKKEWEKIIEAKLIRKFGISTNLIYENK